MADMTGTPERLKFVVALATMDLDKARPGDWSNLRDDLGAFFGLTRQNFNQEFNVRTPGAWLPIPMSSPGTMSDQDLRQLQMETRKILEYVSAPRPAGQKGAQAGPRFCNQTIEKRPYLTDEGGLAYLITGEPHELFLEVLFKLFEQAGSVSPVLRCPECDDLFYRVRKQRYCTRRCVSKANWRTYMKTDAGKTAKRRADKKRRKKVAERKRAAQTKGRVKR